MPHRIQPDWRYTLAQWCLRLIYGRKWHYISPWMKVAAGSAIIFTCKGKVILGQRAGKIEHAGCWGSIGGYLEVQLAETFAQAAVRELFEETGFQLNPTHMPSQPTYIFQVYNQQKFEESSSHAVIAYYVFEVPESFIPQLTPQPETAAFKWFTLAECQTMIKSGQIPHEFTDLHQALQALATDLKTKRQFPTL